MTVPMTNAETGSPAIEFRNFIYISLLSLCGGAALVAVRFALTDKFFYTFLIWNLVLALIPYGIGVAIYAVSRPPRKKSAPLLFAMLWVAWLVFYPNAPYIFTDFIHLVNRTFVRSNTELLSRETLLWYDLVLCSAFAYMGHVAGLISIDLVLRSSKGFLPVGLARAFAAIAIILAGFGIYIGRFIRLNSWDFFLNPLSTFLQIAGYLRDGKAILLSLAFSLFILVTYAVHHLSRKKY